MSVQRFRREFTHESWANRFESLLEEWTRFLERLSPAELERAVGYTNSRGEVHSSRVEDVLTHVLLHGAYHRGQIPSALREAGLTPPLTDDIHAARSGTSPEPGRGTRPRHPASGPDGPSPRRAACTT